MPGANDTGSEAGAPQGERGVASLEGFLDGCLVGLAGGGDGQPLGSEGLFVVDQHRLGLAAAELVIREREPGGAGLQLGEDKDQRLLQRIRPACVTPSQGRKPLGLLLALGRLAAQVLDHPAGCNRCAEAFRYGLGRERRFVALLGQKSGLQLGED